MKALKLFYRSVGILVLFTLPLSGYVILCEPRYGGKFTGPSSARDLASDGRALYVKHQCQACHGANGKEPLNGLYPKVAGQPREYLLNQMKDIKAGKRSNGLSGLMKAAIGGVPDADLEQIAVYLEDL